MMIGNMMGNVSPVLHPTLLLPTNLMAKPPYPAGLFIFIVVTIHTTSASQDTLSEILSGIVTRSLTFAPLQMQNDAYADGYNDGQDGGDYGGGDDMGGGDF